MPLVPLTFYTTLYDAIAKSAAEAMVLYNRSLDPKDNVVVQVDTPFGIEVPINLNTAKGNRTVDLEKASEVFGKKLFLSRIEPAAAPMPLAYHLEPSLISSTKSPIVSALATREIVFSSSAATKALLTIAPPSITLAAATIVQLVVAKREATINL
jgi:hypothetical protein